MDGKFDIRPFSQALQGTPHVHLTPRIPVHWGGYSAIEATILLFCAALAHAGHPFDRLVILQGLEYPIRSNAVIHAFLEANADKEFILTQNISQSTDPKEIHKYSLYWHLDTSDKRWVKLLHEVNRSLFLAHGLILSISDRGFLYFRKASSESKELLDYIDAQHFLQDNS